MFSQILQRKEKPSFTAAEDTGHWLVCQSLWHQLPKPDKEGAGNRVCAGVLVCVTCVCAACMHVCSVCVQVCVCVDVCLCCMHARVRVCIKHNLNTSEEEGWGEEALRKVYLSVKM
jgi:hypothetical protein